jgi:hypothetical protein
VYSGKSGESLCVLRLRPRRKKKKAVGGRQKRVPRTRQEKWKERNVRALPANKVNLFFWWRRKERPKERGKKSFGIKYSFQEPFNQKVESNVRTEYENEESFGRG